MTRAGRQVRAYGTDGGSALFPSRLGFLAFVGSHGYNLLL